MLPKLLLIAVAASGALAQASGYGQCGGRNWNGAKSCVRGFTCKFSNEWYSQCVPGGAAAAPTTVKTTARTTVKTTAKTTANNPVQTKPANNNGGGGGGRSFKASFTQYGAGDTFGSPNCNTKTAACGFYTSPGYSAAVSQNLFGVGPGAGAGPACGSCWRLIINTDSSGRSLSNAGNSIVVQVNNLCPIQGNPLCSQNGLSGTNQYGANVNFDVCSDSGASGALFGNSGVGLGLGTATEVDCSQWSGKVN